jgi:hypothetical protein
MRSSSSNGARGLAISKQLRLTRIDFVGDMLVARFTNGGTISVDVRRYPRLWQATPAQRRKWRLIGTGLGVHWAEIDEDLSVENLLYAGAKGPKRRSP